MKSRRSKTQLINFLREELDLPASFIVLALRGQKQNSGPLPMILWQYGLVSLKQLEQIFNWLEYQTRLEYLEHFPSNYH